MEFSLGLPGVRLEMAQRGPRDANGRRILKKQQKTKNKNKKTKKLTPTMHTKCIIAPQAKNLKWNRGPFWHIPCGLEVSESVKHKFSLVSHIFLYSQLKNTIASSFMTNIRFKTKQLDMSQRPYEPPAQLQAQIMTYYARQELEWNMVHGIYLGLFKTKKLLSPLIYRWRIAQCQRHVKNTEDPVTLEAPRKLVRIIDVKQGISFVYEANTIKKAIEHKILFSDYMFSEPQEPLNLLTNLPLTYGQLMSVILQCKAYGEYSWILEELRARKGCLVDFKIYNRVRLNVEAIKAFFKKPTRVIRETVVDFLRAEADFVDLTHVKVFNFIRAYDTTPDNTMVRKWINHTREYYIAKELNYPGLLDKIDVETEVLLNMIYRLF
jgi:hypothetical protein